VQTFRDSEPGKMLLSYSSRRRSTRGVTLDHTANRTAIGLREGNSAHAGWRAGGFMLHTCERATQRMRGGELLCCGQVCRLCVLALGMHVYMSHAYMYTCRIYYAGAACAFHRDVSLRRSFLSKTSTRSTPPAGKPALFAFRTTALDIESLIGLEEGIFGVVSYHGHREDVRDVHSDFVRDCYQQQQIELIPHFVTFNLYTNVVITHLPRSVRRRRPARRARRSSRSTTASKFCTSVSMVSGSLRRSLERSMVVSATRTSCGVWLCSS
jgi:hypothetical protein